MLLVGDIGGTKTVLALYSTEGGPHKAVVEETFPSADYDSLEAIIYEFLKKNQFHIETACLGVAGPVVENRVQVTNLKWVVDAANLKSEFNLSKVDLLNDLEAVGHAVPFLKPEHLYTITPGAPIKGGNIAILAPGTGLGEGFITFSDGGYRVHPSEGGHVSFSPTNQLQIDLLKYMMEVKGYKHVSYERVCSGGLGIPNLYDFFIETGRYTAPDWLKDQLEKSGDPTPVIFKTGMDESQPCELCTEILDLFISILAEEAGNLALKVLSTGGIYLGGGIPPRMIDWLPKQYFLEKMYAKGRFKSILEKMPVHIIVHTNAGMLGAASHGLRLRLS